ncbi:MAG: TIGR03862 family flavoprotein [Alphaproteobacteria bacterium]
MKTKQILIVGAGPSGLMAAEKLAKRGFSVEIFEQMPTAGRKFLMAGRGGLNLTHSQDVSVFLDAYENSKEWFARHLSNFSADELRAWADNLGADTFIGSSGRVFPKAMKASPLLRAWLRHLEDLGVKLHLNHKWIGWGDEEELVFKSPNGDVSRRADAVILAAGGASWPKLGANGHWVQYLNPETASLKPFKPSNMGFCLPWSSVFQDKYAGSAVKNIRLTAGGKSKVGEFIITKSGIEGGIVYAFSKALRDQIDGFGAADFSLDLFPNSIASELEQRLEKQPRKLSTVNKLRKSLNLKGVQAGLVEEVRRATGVVWASNAELAAFLKNIPLKTKAYQGLEKAISTSGGLEISSLNTALMLKAHPGVFCCGEMLDWEAPTGGYLLQGCFSTAVTAARGVQEYLEAV